MLTVLQKHKIQIGLVVFASFVILSAIIVAGRSTNPSKAAGPPPLPVEVILVDQKYQEGSFVKQAQLLFEIDPRPFQARLEQATGQLVQLKGELGQARSQVTRRELLNGELNLTQTKRDELLSLVQL